MRTVARIASSKTVWISAAILILYAVGGSVVAPHLLERYVPRYVAEQLGARAAVGRIRVNPFLLTIDADDLRLAGQDGQPIATLDRLLIDLNAASLFRWAWTFGEVRLDRLDLHLEVQPDGRLNVASLVERLPHSAPSEEKRPRMLVQHLAMTDSRLTLRDLSGSKPANATLAPLNLEVVDLATLPDRQGRYTVTAALPQGGTMSWHGEVSMLPIASTGELDIKGVKLAAAWPFLHDAIRIHATNAKVDVAAHYRLGYAAHKMAFSLDGVRARIGSLALSTPGSESPALAFDAIAVNDGRFDLASREVVVPMAEVHNGRIAIARGEHGEIRLADALGREDAPAQRIQSAIRSWKYRLETLAVQNVAVSLTDRAHASPFAYDFNVASATLGNIARDSQTPMKFEAALRTAPSGTIDGSGTITQDFQKADAQIKATGVAIAPLQPLLARYATLDLKSGDLSASMQASYDARALHATGAVDISNVLLNEAGTREHFASWRTLSADDVTLMLAPDTPNQLHVKELRVVEPAAKVVISRDRKLNLAEVLKKSTLADSRAAPPSPSAGGKPVTDRSTSDGKASAADRLAVRVDRIRMQNGTVEFADQSLALPFSTRVRRFNGTIVGVASDATSLAELKFDGRIEGSGSAHVEGGLRTDHPTALTEIRVKFENVDVPKLSPYTVTFAGYKVASGRLWLDLQYKIVNGQLAGDNKIALENFTLGERVEGRKVIDLPVALAVAILKDDQGR